MPIKARRLAFTAGNACPAARASSAARTPGSLLLGLVFATVLATPSGAQHLHQLSRSDPVIAEVERLVAAGVLADVHLGQRTLSGREVQRLVREARERLEASPLMPEPDAASVLASLAAITALVGDPAAGEGRALRFRAAGVEGAWLRGPARPIPAYNGLGYVDASVNPLADHGSGRTLPDGATAFAWASGSAALGDRLELAVLGRAGAHDGGAGPAVSAVERLVTSGRIGNVVVTVGRDHVRWGQGLRASTLFTSDAPPLDMIRVSADAPFRLPWILGYAGPVRATFLVADMSGPGHFEGERLAAWKVSILPSARLELGATVASQQGGKGAPAATFAERVADLVPLVDAIFLGDRDLQISNKLAGADIRLRVPEWGGLSVYVDGMLDDFDLRRVASTLREDGAWVAGVSVPPTASRPVGATLEHHHTGLRFYRHGEFRSGVTRRRLLLGNSLGPDADAAHLQFIAARGPFRSLAVSAAVEHRRANVYSSSGGAGPDDGTLLFHLVARNPEERRERATIALMEWLPRRRLQLSAEAGVEWVTGSAHVARAQRTNALVRLAAERRF